jgi:large repetitive protein
LIRDPAQIVNGQPRSITVNNGTFPTGSGVRITLAKPALVPSTAKLADTQNLLYEGWLYAVASGPDGHIIGLYMTKDNGTTWTQVHTGSVPSVNNAVANPTNDPTQPVYDTIGAATNPSGNYNISLTIDPNDPNIVYLGGTSIGQTSGLIRIDTTGIYDSHAEVAYDGSRPDGGAVQLNTTGRAAVKNVNDGPPVLELPTFSQRQYLDLIQDPQQAFLNNTTLYVFNVDRFTNDGSGITWIPFDNMLNANPNDLDPSTNVHQLISYIDPLTGRARLIAADDQGIFTAVDQGDGTLSPGIGAAVSPTFSRNGNLQIAQFFYGAAQPSTVAAQIAGALFYGNGLHTGISASNPGELTPGGTGSGNTNWSSPTADGNATTGGVLNGELDGTGVQVSQQGGLPDPNNPGQKLPALTYQYAFPGLGGAFSDFFQVRIGNGPFISRTQGLVQVANDPQWPIAIPNYPTGVVPGNFAVNPIDGDEVIISSNAGRIFSTINQGKLWLVIGNPGDLDNTYAPALAFGAPDPNGPGGIGNLNNFLYAGTIGGHIFVTQTGGGASGNQWSNISGGLDGSAVLKIVADPTRGSHAAYAVTQKGVYYTANSLAAGGNVWTNITGNLFGLQLTPFGTSGLTNTAIQYLTSIVADWRYVIPNNSSVSGGATHPVLYVSGEAGVYRSLDNGTTWTVYPDNTPVAGSSATLPPAGGLLPDVHVTDLSLAVGNIDPTTGRPVATAGDPNNLVAATLGRGAFTIRLAPIVFPNTATQSNNIHLDTTLPAPSGSSAGVAQDGKTPLVTIPRPFIDGFSEQSAFGNTVFISFYDLTNPNSPKLIGGFDASNPATAIPANETNAAGQFSIQVNAGAFTFNGTKVIGIQATDASGTKGNMATFTFVLNANLPLPNPPAVPTIALSPFDDSSHGQGITNITRPHIIGTTDPNTAVALFFSAGGNTTGGPLATGTSDANGNFSLQFPNALPPGPVTVQVVATNVFGSSNSAPLSFTIKTQGPSTAPTLGLLAADDSGIKGDGYTSVRNPHFIGKTDANAIVDIYSINDLNTVLAETTADANGNYSVQLPFNLHNGTISLEAKARDVAGNVGPIGNPFTLHIVTTGGDYTGNGTADLALYKRTVPATWFIQGVTPVSGTSFGVGTQEIPIEGDFIGSGQDQLATYNPNTATWFIQGLFPNGVQFGQGSVDLPAPADYSGTGVTQIAVFRPTTGQWFIGGSATPLPAFGGPGDVPVPGDYDNLGHAQQAIYRPSTGQFFIGGHAQPITLGSPNEIPVPGFYDNTTTSHRKELAVYNATTGVLTVLGPNNATRTYQFAPGSVPAPHDYDGVGSDEPAAFNPSTGAWTIYAPGSGTPKTVNFGAAGEIPVGAPFNYRKLPVKGDYTGIGSSQEALYQASTGQFIIGGGVTSTSGLAFGAANSIPLQGDFNGSGTTDIASYNPSTATWYVQGVYSNGLQFGAPNLDIPVPGDYTGNGVTQVAVFRPTTGQWFIAGNAGSSATLGQQGDVPVPGNYDRTGKDEFAVFRPSTNQWLIGGPNGLEAISFGGNGDVPIPGNYDGNGATQIAVFRPSTDQWFIGGHAQPITFGGPGDIPAPGDYHGVGHLEIAVFRPSTGQLFVAGYAPVSLGNSQDVPVNAPYAYRVPGNHVSSTSVTINSGKVDLGSTAVALSTGSSSSSSSSSTTTQTPSSSTPIVANSVGQRLKLAAGLGHKAHGTGSLGRFGRLRRR